MRKVTGRGGVNRLGDGVAVETFRYASWLPFPRDVVWRWHEQPHALTLLTPPSQRLTLLERTDAPDGSALGTGTRLKMRVRDGLLPVTILAEHVDAKPPHSFTDSMLRGPFRRWVHHHLFDVSVRHRTHGTLVTDIVHWQLPLAPVSHWFAGWLVRRKLQAMFAYRHEALLRDLLGDDAPSLPPDASLRLAGVAVE
jgi:ligand-binding SRPBCC domain-containing protein